MIPGDLVKLAEGILSYMLGIECVSGLLVGSSFEYKRDQVATVVAVKGSTVQLMVTSHTGWIPATYLRVIG